MIHKSRTGLAVGWLLAGVLSLGCDQNLQGELEEDAANEILALLAGERIDAHKVPRGTEGLFAVTVASADRSRALRLLRAAGLPRRRHAGFASAYRERGLVPGRLEEQAVFLAALQEEIAATLESVVGVAEARVHVTAGFERASTRTPSPAPSAAVLLRCTPGTGGAPPLSEAEVQRLVASAVVGLVPERVAVVFSPVRLLEPSPISRPSFPLRDLAAALVAAAGVAGVGFWLWRRRRTAWVAETSRISRTGRLS